MKSRPSYYFLFLNCFRRGKAKLVIVMNSPLSIMRHIGQRPHLAHLQLLRPSLFISSHPHSQSRPTSTKSTQPSPCCSKKEKSLPPSALSRDFWTSKQTWRRSGINTFRCLVGCTLGDFSAMWYLQAFHPEMGMESVMAISSKFHNPEGSSSTDDTGRPADSEIVASGLSTSLLLETVLLKLGRDRLPWLAAAKTAAGMSMISMITMEAAENAVDYHLTGGNIQLDDPAFWMAALVSMAAGYLTPLPYNYHRLRKYGKACH